MWTLTFFCPRGEWGGANAVRGEWSMRSAKEKGWPPGCEKKHFLGLQVGVTIAQTISDEKKMMSRKESGF